MQTEAAKADEDGRKMLQQRPHLQGELYRIFLNRIRFNFHLVLQYSPSGSNFKEKITRHPELLYYSQVLFMRDLAAPELENLGVSFLKKQAQTELENRDLADAGVSLDVANAEAAMAMQKIEAMGYHSGFPGEGWGPWGPGAEGPGA